MYNEHGYSVFMFAHGTSQITYEAELKHWILDWWLTMVAIKSFMTHSCTASHQTISIPMQYSTYMTYLNTKK